MQPSKRHFQQVPVEMVKQMMETERSQGPSNNSWRNLAQAAANEPDGTKMINMVEEMLDKFDERQRKNGLRGKPARSGSDS